MPQELSVDDFDDILSIINDAATAYAGIIPADRYHEPYMTPEYLKSEMEDGVVFWGLADGGRLAGVMGIQDKGDVTLIRHAYVLTSLQGRGIGSRLMRKLKEMSDTPYLVGTWKAAVWAISFYEGHGFEALGHEMSQDLLSRYWDIPERQAVTSLVLADERWLKGNGHE